MKRLAPTLSLVAVVAALAGCGRGGSDDPSAGRPSTVDTNDDRAVALDCLTRVRGLHDARLDGEHDIVVGADDTGPKIRFFLTGGESEARQFEGKAEGSEQIGNTLLYVRKGSDDVIEDVEFCLDHL